jgi:hypothetical protein
MYASFTAWQILSSQSGIDISWEAYKSKLGLTVRAKRTEEQINQDIETANLNVQKIIDKANKKNG